MPPTQHSTSTAHKESDGLQPNGLYTLGEYSFRLERSSVPGSTNDKIEAICMKDGQSARKSIQIPSSTQLSGWYVEANEDTASVYVMIRKPEGSGRSSELDTGNVPQPINTISSITSYQYKKNKEGEWEFYSSRTITAPAIVTSHLRSDGTQCTVLGCGATGDEMTITTVNSSGESREEKYVFGDDITVDGKSAGWIQSSVGGVSTGSYKYSTVTALYPDIQINKRGQVSWTVIYGTPSGTYGEPETVLIGRFAIDLGEAGGVGPGSDWDDPGDWNEDWEEGDPTQTLHVEVMGALSGRHNDPIEDPSYSYIPADKETVKGYGCGGDGGHGGGGGAGASTVVVYKFATNQADGKEIVALAKRHGYGSGGGKGGKGGDGCILVYY